MLPRYFQGPGRGRGRGKGKAPVSRNVELLRAQLLLAEDEIIKAVLHDSAIDHLQVFMILLYCHYFINTVCDVCTRNGTATPFDNMAKTWKGWSRQSGLCSTTPSLLTSSLSIIVVLMVLTVGASTIVHWQMVNRHHHITQNSQLCCSR